MQKTKKPIKSIEEKLDPDAIDPNNIIGDSGEPISQIKNYIITREVDSFSPHLEKVLKNISEQYKADLDIEVHEVKDLENY